MNFVYSGIRKFQKNLKHLALTGPNGKFNLSPNSTLPSSQVNSQTDFIAQSSIPQAHISPVLPRSNKWQPKNPDPTVSKRIGYYLVKEEHKVVDQEFDSKYHDVYRFYRDTMRSKELEFTCAYQEVNTYTRAKILERAERKGYIDFYSLEPCNLQPTGLEEMADVTGNALGNTVQFCIDVPGSQALKIQLGS
jgi:hypothetical protein